MLAEALEAPDAATTAVRQSTLQRLDQFFAEWPALASGPAPTSEIDAAELQLGQIFPSDYREFLARYGGAIVGSTPIYGLQSVDAMGDETVLEVTARYREDGWPGTELWLVVSSDGGGNPVGINRAGELWTFDHNVGSFFRAARSFEDFIEQLLDEIDSA